MLPSIALYTAARSAALAMGIDIRSIEAPARDASVGEFIGAVVLAPIGETLLLGLLLWALSRLSSRPVFIACVAAALWGGLHGSLGALWFFGTFWSFYVFSCSYLAWRPQAYWKAFVVAAAPHALINLSAMLAVLFF